jgi:hypothetical protein
LGTSRCWQRECNGSSGGCAGRRAARWPVLPPTVAVVKSGTQWSAAPWRLRAALSSEDDREAPPEDNHLTTTYELRAAAPGRQTGRRTTPSWSASSRQRQLPGACYPCPRTQHEQPDVGRQHLASRGLQVLGSADKNRGWGGRLPTCALIGVTRFFAAVPVFIGAVPSRIGQVRLTGNGELVA